MFFKIILFVFELVCAFEILNKSNCTSVGETQGRYSLLVVYHFFFFTRVQQISFGFNATAYAMPTFGVRQVFVEKINFLNKISYLNFTLRGQCRALCFLHLVHLAVNSSTACFFDLHATFLFLFAMISSSREQCCTRLFPQLKLLIFEESCFRANNNFPTLTVATTTPLTKTKVFLIIINKI